MNQSFENLSELVVDWAEEKGIFANSDLLAQLKKTAEEVQEVRWELEKFPMDDTAVVLEYGDVLVTLIIQITMLGYTPNECLEAAYDKISKRNGEMRDGVFVKEEDL